MSSVEDRLGALSADDKALARRIVKTRQAKAQLAELEPKLAEIADENAEAEARMAEVKEFREQIIKERKAFRNLFASSYKKRVQSENLSLATLEGVQAWREVDASRSRLAARRQEKTVLTKTVQQLRTDAETQKKVAALLAAVFDGPTPDYPEEDRLEDAVKAAQAAYDEADKSTSTAKERSDTLEDLRQQLKDLREKILEEATTKPLG